MMNLSASIRGGVLASAALATFALSACGSPNGTSGDPSGDAGLTGSIAIDGSSTVAPLSEAAADLFSEVEPGVQVTVATSGTGGGFKVFCAGETQISDASRPIKEEEAAECAANGIEYTEIVIANDGLAVVVSNENDWAQCLTVEQLQTMWAPESEGSVTNWNQIDPSFPDVPLALFGPGTDSGTFDYFTEEVNGETGAIRTDYSPSEDDNILVQGISGDQGGAGFFGLSYVVENADLVRAVDVDGGSGCVTPSLETVQDGSYSPLGRPLFIYVNNAEYTGSPAMQAFVDYYVANQEQIALDALYIPLTAAQQQVAADELASLG